MQPGGPSRNVNPEELAPARGFSHATVAGDTVWVGGQVGSDATGKIIEPGDIVAQYGRAIHNVAVALRAAGFEPQDTVKLTYYVTDIKAYRENRTALGAAYRKFFRRARIPRLSNPLYPLKSAPIAAFRGWRSTCNRIC